MIPYGRQSIDEADIAAVVDVLKSDWLTTGPMVERFEAAAAAYVGTAQAVAVSSGTAALHAMMAALEIGPGDEVIVPALTFAATANCVVYQGGVPVFADVDPDTLLISPESVERCLSPRTRAVIAVDYAGQPCDYAALQSLADRHSIRLLADACHSLGAHFGTQASGSIALMTAFSFHPVKPITTGEGGMVTTDDERLAAFMRTFRNHGITTDARQREQAGTWYYEMRTPGFNYRISDIQCALGIEQLKKLDGWIDRRSSIAAIYDRAFADHDHVIPVGRQPGSRHAWHLYVVRLPGGIRRRVYEQMRTDGIGVNVHYIPVHLHPFYRQRFGTGPGLCPAAEAAYEDILSLPVHPGLTDDQVQTVIDRLLEAVQPARRAA